MADEPTIQYDSYGHVESSGADQRKQERADMRQEVKNPGQAQAREKEQVGLDRATLSNVVTWVEMMKRLHDPSGDLQVDLPIISLRKKAGGTTAAAGTGALVQVPSTGSLNGFPANCVLAAFSAPVPLAIP